MWANVLLERQLAKGFLKAALRSHHIRYTGAENSHEAQQLKRLRTDINRSRCEKAALYYGLIFNNVILNEVSWGGNYLFVSDAEDNYNARSPFTDSSPEFEAFVRPTNPLEQQAIEIYDMSPRDKANLFAMTEPLIWNSWRKAGKERITRAVLRDVLDFMALNPDVVQVIRHCDDYESEPLSSWRSSLSPLADKYFLDPNAIRYFLSTIYVTYTKGEVALSSVYEARKLDAAFPVGNLTFGKGRRSDEWGQLAAVKDEDIVAGVRLFLEEIDHFPVIETFDDVVRIRSHKDFATFRMLLQRWLAAITTGDLPEEGRIRAELRKSNSALRRAVKCESIGRYFVYIGLPLLVLDALVAPVFGTSLTLTGFGVQAYADWQAKQHGWLLVGNDKK